MSISLEKRTESALISLQKIVNDSPIDLGDLVAQVDVAIDFSGSMNARYPGEMQEAVERMLALTLTGLDDDGVVPIYPFANGLFDVEPLTVKNYQGWVERFYSTHSMGGTAYGPFLDKMLGGGKRKLFGRGDDDEKNDPPFFHIIFTDGEPRDSKRDIEQRIIGARTRPHFFQFVLLGNDLDGKAYLDKLNRKLTGPGIDNVGLTVYSDRPTTDDVGFFNDTIREFFLEWLPLARQNGYTSR